MIPRGVQQSWRRLPAPIRYSLIGASAYASVATAVYLASGGWRIDGATAGIVAVVVAYYTAAAIIGAIVHSFPRMSSRPAGRVLLGYGSAFIATSCLMLAVFGAPWRWGGQHVFTILMSTMAFGTYLAINWRSLFRPIGT